MKILPNAALGAIALAALFAASASLTQPRPDETGNPFANDPTAAAAGRVIFNGTCVACHGPDATGGRGPALNTGGFAHGGDDSDLFQTIRGGVPGTQMPPFSALKSDDVWRLVAYIRSLSGGTAQGMAQEAAAGDPARGEAVFFGSGGCSSCHEVNGRGGDVGPDLSAVGANPAPLRPAVLHSLPPLRRGRADVPRRLVEATLADGTRLRGVATAEDSFSLVLRTPDGQVRSLDKGRLRAIGALPGVLTGKEAGARLSAADMNDVVAYLRRQTRRDFAEIAREPLPAGVSYARIAHAQTAPQDWLSYWGGYDGRHFSGLGQITPANVGGLQARWAVAMPGDSVLEATPIVVDGVMYVSGMPGEVYALDARTGLRIWAFRRRQETVSPYQNNPYNRGVAVLGPRVFVTTLDDRIIALDARTGRELWEKQIADAMAGYTMTGAPLALKDEIVVGISGGEHGIRGFVDAYDAATGKRLWRFYTVPGPGQPGNETWSGSSWKHGSSATWLTGSFDPDLNLVYWAVGNPGPDNNSEVREGDNLYSCSVLALDATTGQLRWSYQFTPNDSHDWDSTEDLVLADQRVNGRLRKVILHADRNGFFYVLDRTDGRFLGATPFVRQTWNAGFDAKGRPKVRPESVSTPTGDVVFPAVGATNFQAPSYDARTGVFYLGFLDSQGFAASAPVVWEEGRLYLGRGGGRPPPTTAPSYQGIKALDSTTGKTLWTFPLVRPSLQAGVLGTRGGVLFAASAEGNLIALDMSSGKPLWRFQTGAAITASPMSYAVDGRQYVAIAAGNTLYSFALPDKP